MDDAVYSKARAYAFRRLAMRNQPSSELRKKMGEKGFPSQIVERVIEECEKAGFLSDEEWIRGFIASQLRKSVGPQGVLQKLLQKGISREIAQKWVTVEAERGQKEGIRAFIQKRHKGKGMLDRLERQKTVQALLRKGFSLPVILQELEIDEELIS